MAMKEKNKLPLTGIKWGHQYSSYWYEKDLRGYYKEFYTNKFENWDAIDQFLKKQVAKHK